MFGFLYKIIVRKQYVYLNIKFFIQKSKLNEINMGKIWKQYNHPEDIDIKLTLY